MDHKKFEITHSEEYKEYMQALCWLASKWVARIRLQFAQKAYDMYQDETVRKLVLAYGEEHRKLEKHRLSDFEMASDWENATEVTVEDYCLNNAGHYAQAIYYLFGIE